MLANFARHEPEAVAALRSQGPAEFGRLLRLPAPEPYQPPAKRKPARPSAPPRGADRVPAAAQRCPPAEPRQRHAGAHAARSATPRGRPSPVAQTERRRRAGRTPGPTAPTGQPTGSGPCVVLAGGGTAGHIEPALALADAVMRLRPDARVTALGTARGLESNARPGPRLPAGADPAGADAAQARRRPADAAAQGARRGEGDPARCSTGSAPTWWSASAATSRCRPTWPPAAGSRSSCTRPTRAPGWPTRSAPGSPPGSPSPCRTRAARRARSSASRCGSSITDAGPGRAAGRGPRRSSGCTPDAPTLLVSGGSQGARRSTPRRPARPRQLAEAGHRGAARARTRRTARRCRTVAGAPAYVAGAVPGADGPRLRRRRPGAVPVAAR